MTRTERQVAPLEKDTSAVSRHPTPPTNGLGEPSETPIETFGQIVRKARGTMTQEDMGQLLNIKGVYVGKLEKGARYPGPYLLDRFARLSGIDIIKLKDIIKYETEPDSEFKKQLEARLVERYYSPRKRGRKPSRNKYLKPSRPLINPEVIYFRGRQFKKGTRQWAIMENIFTELGR